MRSNELSKHPSTGPCLSPASDDQRTMKENGADGPSVQTACAKCVSACGAGAKVVHFTRLSALLNRRSRHQVLAHKHRARYCVRIYDSTLAYRFISKVEQIPTCF
jgi:hypothetical protein